MYMTQKKLKYAQRLTCRVSVFNKISRPNKHELFIFSLQFLQQNQVTLFVKKLAVNSI